MTGCINDEVPSTYITSSPLRMEHLPRYLTNTISSDSKSLLAWVMHWHGQFLRREIHIAQTFKKWEEVHKMFEV